MENLKRLFQASKEIQKSLHEIVTVIGAKVTQFVKAAVVSRALQQIKNANEVIVHTGQHYDANMSDIFLKK
jgi:UDP-GlcNAc3NAcA epimerase